MQLSDTVFASSLSLFFLLRFLGFSCLFGLSISLVKCRYLPCYHLIDYGCSSLFFFLGGKYILTHYSYTFSSCSCFSLFLFFFLSSLYSLIRQNDVQSVQHTWEENTNSQYNTDYTFSTPSTDQKD